MSDEIDKINNEFRETQIPDTHGDYSGAKNSKITHPEVDAQKKSIAEGIIAELGNHTNEIDGIKQSIGQLAEMINQQTQAINQLGQQGIQQAAPPGPSLGGQSLNLESVMALGDVAEKLVGAYKNLKGAPPAASPLIDQDFINKRMVESFMDDLDTGKSIGAFIKKSLQKNVTKGVINSTLKNIGDNVNEPEHGPQ